MKLDTVPELFAITVCASFDKKAFSASDPDLIPKIDIESEAFKVPPLPSLKNTVIVFVLFALGSSESGSVNVAELVPVVVVAATSVPPSILNV